MIGLMTLLLGCASHRAVGPDYATGDIPGRQLVIRVIGDAELAPYKSGAYAAEAFDCAIGALADARLDGAADYACEKLPSFVRSETIAELLECEPMRPPPDWSERTVSAGKDALSLWLPAEGSQAVVGTDVDVVLLLEHLGVGCGQVSSTSSLGGVAVTSSSATLDVFYRYALWDNRRGALMTVGTISSSEALKHLQDAPLAQGLPSHRFAVATMFRGTGLAR